MSNLLLGDEERFCSTSSTVAIYSIDSVRRGVALGVGMKSMVAQLNCAGTITRSLDLVSIDYTQILRQLPEMQGMQAPAAWDRSLVSINPDSP